jgi:hypothetical protein
MESDPRTNRELPTNYFYFSIRNGIKVFKEQKTRDGGGSLLILKTQIVKERGGERERAWSRLLRMCPSYSYM